MAALLALPLAACQEAAPTFKPVTIYLDETEPEPTFPAGTGVEAVTNNCSACHSPDMILNQPKLTRAEWAKSIDKMRKVFKAEIAEADEAAILDYLEGVSTRVK